MYLNVFIFKRRRNIASKFGIANLNCTHISKIGSAVLDEVGQSLLLFLRKTHHRGVGRGELWADRLKEIGWW